jgi:hypothetical protein
MGDHRWCSFAGRLRRDWPGSCGSKSRDWPGSCDSLPNGSRFTTENIMKVRAGMRSNEILEMFCAPKNVSQSVCGAAVGKPWTCITWEYGEHYYDWASFTFAGHSGSLVLNDFNVHTK